MPQIYYIPDYEVMLAYNYVEAVMRHLKNQGAPIGDDLELEKGWKMSCIHDINNGKTVYRIFSLECE